LSDEQNKNSKRRDNEIQTENPSMVVLHLDTLDQGTEAFMQWLNSEDKQSTNNPIILKEFVNNKRTILYDNTLSHDVIVETYKGVPKCQSCQAGRLWTCRIHNTS
jgi:hypothetical protein